MAPSEPSPPDRFRPHAAREMSGMFDDVSGRYDLLNRLMTLGQDQAWREAMWREVPADAAVVLDLCTGSGVSLPGLRRPGRRVLAIDVSLRMLERAAAEHGGIGWAPRFVCADAFRLPLAGASVDAVTVAFGMRNLRPRTEALAEIARVLRPGGTLVVLEAAAPAPGPLAPYHAAWIRHAIPALGWLSPDPSAYRYLSASIFEFGSGEAFERDLAHGGFSIAHRAAFLLGATRLWSARRSAEAGQRPAGRPQLVQAATTGGLQAGQMPHAGSAVATEWRIWNALQALLSVALATGLAYGLWSYAKLKPRLPLEPWQEGALQWLMAAGAILFAVRAVALALRLTGPPPAQHR